MKLQRPLFNAQGYFWVCPWPILSTSSTLNVLCSLVPIPMPVSLQTTCSLNQCIRPSSSTCSRKSGRICTSSSSGVALKVGRVAPEALSCVTSSLLQLMFTLNGHWYSASVRRLFWLSRGYLADDSKEGHERL